MASNNTNPLTSGEVANTGTPQVVNPQVVYISRERKIRKFSCKQRLDEDTVEDCVDNVRSLISARKMGQIEQTDFETTTNNGA